MNASVAQHPQLRFGDSALYGEEGNCSRAFHNGKNDPAPDAYLHGYNFEEQMERVLEADPSILLLTGWNEWIAGRWQGTNERPIMFVDTASANYSRDFEMMRDGYGDLYYLQMLASVRRFKGMDPLPVPEIGQTLCFLGTSDGNLHRHAEGYGQVYHNTTGRNAIRSLSLTLEADRLHLSIKTAGPLSPSIEGCFLRTYLTVGDAPAFTHILIPEHDRAILYAACGLTVGAKLASFPLESETDGISFALPYHALGLRGGDALSIKVADAVTEYESTDDFYDIGDTLPLGNLSLRMGLPKEIS